MGVNHVTTADGEELINLMSDTVTEDTLLDGVTAHDASGEQIVGQFTPYAPNLLDNGDFSVNQRGISGLFSTVGAYFVDRWKLVEGTVTINADGTITLNGTISQILEHDINEQHLAYASAGTASYDAATRTYTITSLGETIRWAMLVNGKTRMPFIKGNEALELAKCQRCQVVIDEGTIFAIGRTHNSTDTLVSCFIPLPVTPRATGSVAFAGSIYVRNIATRNVVKADFISSISKRKNGVELVASISTGFGTATPCIVEISSSANSPIIFDFNL